MRLLRQIRIKNIIMLIAAGVLSAVGVTLFLEPVKLYDSGISGTAMLLGQLTPSWLSLSIFLIVLDFPLFLYGLKKQGGLFTFYSVFTVSIYSLCAWIINDIIPFNNSVTSPLAGNDVLLCAIFGGLICGAGSGLAVRYGGAIDGIEVLAVIFSKRIGLTVGTFMMIYNVILYTVCGVILKSWILPLYSIVTYVVALKTIDFFVDGIDGAKAAMIVTVRPDEICTALTNAFETGATKISATGGYSGTPKTIVYFVVNRFQVTKMKNLVHSVDPKAFITINEVADIFSANQDKE